MNQCVSYIQIGGVLVKYIYINLAKLIYFIHIMIMIGMDRVSLGYGH